LKKNLLISFAFSLLMLSFNVNAELNANEVLAMENSIKENLKDAWKTPSVKACWSSYQAGSYKSLSALYLMGKSINTIKEISSKRSAMFSELKSKRDLVTGIKKTTNKKDFLAIKEAIVTLPKTTEYCQKIYEVRK